VSPAGTEMIAARKERFPGLWDMHAHVGDNDGLLNLARRHTVRDMANDTTRFGAPQTY
jgi:hypothetical protein